ncbi:MAG: putative E3 ubiquitin-protein ligase HTD2 [Alyxoria varia]|nr:MAG: putative E3 ubiquitin-protein ligase HTD2 [Alyxoria varia]
MPGWPSRFLSTSATHNNSSANHRGLPSSNTDKELPHLPRAPFPPFPGSPQHAAQDRPTQVQPEEMARPNVSPRRRSHARSVSDKLPSIFGGGRRKTTSAAPEPESRSFPTEGEFMSELAPPPVNLGSKGKHDERDGHVDIGNCATCDSRMKWPKGVGEFRCSTCLMVNDLNPVNTRFAGPKEPGHVDGGRSGTYPAPNPERKAMSLTLERTKSIINRCIESYIEAYIHGTNTFATVGESGLSELESPKLQSLSPFKGTWSPAFDSPDPHKPPIPFSSVPPEETYLRPGNLESIDGRRSADINRSKYNAPRPRTAPRPGEQKNFVPGIARKPLPTPVESLPVRPSRKPPPPPVDVYSGAPEEHLSSVRGEQGTSLSTYTPHTSRVEGSPNNLSNTRIFQPLEDYIARSFGDHESLNASFLKSRPPARKAPYSEEDMRARRPASPLKTANTPEDPISEIDPKLLLLGDFAENGLWWTGKGQRATSLGRRQGPDHLSENRRRLVHSKSPQINWTEVDAWFQSILSAGRDWRTRLKYSNDLANDHNSSTKEAAIDEAFAEARAHLRKSLLKTSEALLKRPGRSLRDPGSIRFLLIILANPLLHPNAASNSIDSFNARQDSEHLAITFEQDHTKRSSPDPDRSSWEQNNVFGIIKRTLGLLGNSSSECHRYLTSWYARFDEERFRSLVDLIGRFVTYRMKRQQGRKKSNAGNPIAGLIPNLSGTTADTSAQLHAALGLGNQQKSMSDRNRQSSYVDDWQVKVAAKVMALLFVANKNFHGERSPQSLEMDARMSKPGSLSRTYIKNHGQLLSTSEFYNTMVDFADLIADFDMWESTPSKFAFCQYPFFLSVSAKTKIMEHDARRQMEGRAREAFFNNILRNQNLEQYLSLRVRRDCLVEDSLNGISEAVGANHEDVKKGLRVHFIGEEGVDAGGLRKEWFLSLVREIFDPHHALFLYDEESRFCYFNPYSFETSDRFFLVGALLGLAIYNSTILDVALPPFTFKKLLMSGSSQNTTKTPYNRAGPLQYTLEDLAEYKPALARGLRQLLDYDGNVQETFCRDFVIEVDRYGSTSQVPLCTNGANRPVTNANRHEFVDLYIKYLLDGQVARQFEPFKRGFFTVCGGNALSLFQPEEIELLVRGSDEPLDVHALKAVAVYEGWNVVPDRGDKARKRPVANPAEHLPLLRWFWELFEAAAPQDQRKLLSFVTGSDRVPAVGATDLVIKVCFGGGDRGRLPIARTCFNQIVLFGYESRTELEGKLWMAVRGSEGFGLK